MSYRKHGNFLYCLTSKKFIALPYYAFFMSCDNNMLIDGCQWVIYSFNFSFGMETVFFSNVFDLEMLSYIYVLKTDLRS